MRAREVSGKVMEEGRGRSSEVGTAASGESEEVGNSTESSAEVCDSTDASDMANECVQWKEGAVGCESKRRGTVQSSSVE